MGLIKRKNKTIKSIIFKQFLIIIFEELIFLVVYIMINTMLINMGIFQQANQTEQYLLNHKSDIVSKYPFDERMVPTYCTYGLYDDFMNYTSGTLSEYDIENGKKVIEAGDTYRGTAIAMKLKEGYVVFSYDLRMHMTNPKIDKYIFDLELVIVLICGGVCILIIILNASSLSKKMKKEMFPIEEAIANIKERDLDFDIGASTIKEFDDILKAQGDMKDALAKSLKAEWESEQRRRHNISALAHDLKTPLTIIKGNAELMKEENDIKEIQDEIEIINYNADKIERYIRLLIDEAKGKGTEKNVVIDADEFIDRVIDVCISISTSEKMNIDIKKDRFNRDICVDVELVERAIVNIVSNALEYTDTEKGIKISFENMEYGSKETNDITKIFKVKVEDYGKGFSNIALKHFKEEFFTERVERSNEHYGLGMNFAVKIAEKYEGDITVMNKDDNSGAIVEFKIIR